MKRCLTELFSRRLVPYSVREWNLLPNDIDTASNIDTFKSKMNKFIQNR